ncbi:MAG: hypothetical protein U5L11_04325 [Arhodomonas sp.]|nr:hypothetical protein [Arhodomonas sp.]
MGKRLCIAVLLLVAAPVLLARGGDLDRAVREAEERTGGEVIATETVTRADGRQVHRLRVLIGEGASACWRSPPGTIAEHEGSGHRGRGAAARRTPRGTGHAGVRGGRGRRRG